MLALALGVELLQPPRRVPPPAHLHGKLGTHRPACPCSHVALRPQSSGTGRRDHPVGWPPPPQGPLPEGQGRGTLAAPVARSSGALWQRPAGAGARSPSPPPAPASCPLSGAPARPSRLAQQRTHSLRGRLQGYPRGGGWGRLRPLAFSAAFLLPRPFRRSRATGIQTPKQKRLQSPGREVELGGRQASGRGAALAGSGRPESRVRRGRGKRGLWLRLARSEPRSLGRGQRAGAAGSTEAPETPRARWGAETSGRPNLPRKLTK